MRAPLTVALAISVIAAACGAPPPAPEPVSQTSEELTIGGCTCPTSGSCSALTFSNIPANNTYYITTFGGGSDTQSMACGGTADATWAYVADEERFGCGAKLLVSAGGKSCVAQVADCGPNRCVEQAAANDSCASNFPIIDASPFITEYLLGISGSGWSDHTKVTAVKIEAASTVGCPGVPVREEDAGTSSSKKSSSGGSSGGHSSGSSEHHSAGSSASHSSGSSEHHSGTGSRGNSGTETGSGGEDGGASASNNLEPAGSSGGCALSPNPASRGGSHVLALGGLVAWLARRRPKITGRRRAPSP